MPRIAIPLAPTLVVILVAALMPFFGRSMPQAAPAQRGESLRSHAIDPNRRLQNVQLNRSAVDEGASPRAPLWTIATPANRVRLQAYQRALNSGAVDRPTEALARYVETQLSAFFKASFSNQNDRPWQAAVAADFACAHLRPTELATAFADRSIVIRRGDPRTMMAARPTFHGQEGLARALRAFADPLHFEAAQDAIEVELSVDSVDLRDDVAATGILLRLRHVSQRQAAQISARWACLWQRRENHWRISAIRPQDYEEVLSREQRFLWYSDCTESVLGDNRSWHRQLHFGLDHWLTRIERGHGMHFFACTGLAIGDANGDGLEDLYVCQAGGLPNRLFIQDVDGSAVDYSIHARVDWLDHTSSALFLDLDNDADQDLVLATDSGILIMENDAAGRFQLRVTLPLSEATISAQSLASADFDADGDLDLFACFSADRHGSPPSRTGFMLERGGMGAQNALIRNDSQPGKTWSFVDVTEQVGMLDPAPRDSRAASWEDYDHDGDLDLYVVNSDGGNYLYRNDGGQFVDVATEANLNDEGISKSASWGDFNHDGKADLYVGNVFSAVGRRLHTLRSGPQADDSSWPASGGNSLYLNLGAGRFGQVDSVAAVQHAGWAWSSLFLDIDNSGREDLFVANGFRTASDARDTTEFAWRQALSAHRNGEPSSFAAVDQSSELLASALMRAGGSFAAKQRHRCFLNTGSRRFADVSAVSGLDLPDDGRAAVRVDWDQDGDLDLWIANRNGPQIRFLCNQVPNNHHYVALRLEGTQCNRDAIGARVELTARGRQRSRQLKTLRAGDGFMSQSSKWIHIGLGQATHIERLDVVWPGGERETFSGLRVDGPYVLKQGTGRAQPFDGPKRHLALKPSAIPYQSQIASRSETQPFAGEVPTAVFLARRLPLTELAYETSAGRVTQIDFDTELPTLVMLWNARCGRCEQALDELLMKEDAIRQAKLRVFLLETDDVTFDGADDSTPSARQIPPTSAFVSGQSTTAMVDAMQSVLDKLFDRNLPLPIPCALLLDQEGRIAAIYRAALPIDRIIADVAKLDLPFPQRRQASVLFPGRWTPQTE